MVNVFDVADWFLNKEPMTPKKLQKLVYYAYAWGIALLNEDGEDIRNKLFDSRIEAWVHGPVCRELYFTFRDNGVNGIKEGKDGDVFDADQEDVLNQVWEVYQNFNGNELESITHQEEPWIQARDGFSSNEICTNKLSDKIIYSYYNSRLE